MNETSNRDRLFREIVQAAIRIRAQIRETPLLPVPELNDLCGGEIFFKPENWQVTGSFKVRGAANRLLVLDKDQKSKGAVSASTGNHGAAFAFLAEILDIPGILFLPETAPAAKVKALLRTGVDVRHFGDDCVKAEIRAREFARETGRVFVSPYNDPLIVAGQGTIALEIHRQAGPVDDILVPAGGGGLISGIAAGIKTIDPRVRILGCQPENSAVLAASVRAGRILDLPSLPTLSDATAGGLEPGSITLPLCRELVDEFILLTEKEISFAIRWMIDRCHMLVEGAAALPVAALLRRPETFSGRRAVLILSGCRIGGDTLKRILDEEETP